MAEPPDHLRVDIPALRNAGADLAEWSSLADQIATMIYQAAAHYADAGGTRGEMAELWEKNYKPGEEKAIEFLKLLQQEVGGAGMRTIQAADSFEQTDGDASRSVPNT
jgi:hypothetical protein